jgi:hypothetical protein
MTDRRTKQLEVPLIAELDSLENPNDIVNCLDERAPRRTIESVNWEKVYPYRPLTTFTIAHSGKNIYIDFFVRCNYLRAENYENQSPVSADSCVEFFVEPTGELPYWNFEFNCIGAINASHRSERRSPVRLSDDELARIKRFPSCGTRPFRELEGLFTWNLLVVIPLDLMGVEYHGEPIAMRGNFYKCASAATQPHYMSWNPIETDKPDFHRPDFFGDIILK